MDVDVSVVRGDDAFGLFDATKVAAESTIFTSAPWVQAAWSELPRLGAPLVVRIATNSGERLLPLAVCTRAERGCEHGRWLVGRRARLCRNRRRSTRGGAHRSTPVGTCVSRCSDPSGQRAAHGAAREGGRYPAWLVRREGPGTAHSCCNGRRDPESRASLAPSSEVRPP